METEYRQVKKKPANLLKRTGFYAVLSFVLCFVILAMVNHSIVFGNSGDNSAAGASSIGARVVTGVPADAQDISFSYDDKYCSYLYDSQIYIKDIAKNTDIKTISDTGITWAQIMNDRDNILYFTQNSNSLALKTYSIDSDTSTKQLSFKITAGTKIKDVDYSNATNLIYLNLESTSSKGKTTDTIYSVNIMKQLTKISSSSIVDNMVLLNNTGSLYFEDADSNLYDRVKHVVDLQTGHLIGCDSQDRVYVQSLDDKSSISVISGSKVVNTLQLPDTDYIEFYSDKSNVYVIYDDYIINLSGDLSAKFTYDKSLTFLGLGGSNIYFRDSAGDIVVMASSFQS
jgi:hypothetical protein